MARAIARVDAGKRACILAAMPRTRVGLVEALGLRPFRTTAAQVRITLAGDATTPKSRFDLTSLKQLQPRFAVPLWLGEKPLGRRVPVTNLFNYLQPPPELGWSVRVTNVRDFRGGKNTYDSHNGTDFAIPPGTDVLAAAPAVVLRVSSEFHRGGRKVVLDHGRGLVTTYNHLARPLVAPGQRVKRGQRVALSGYSGIDALVGFPWTPPHVHMNCWLNCAYVDPFTPVGESGASLWRQHNDPVPATGIDLDDDRLEPTRWDEDAIRALVTHCKSDASRAEIEGAKSQVERAGAAILHWNYFPTRFDREALAAWAGPEGFCLHRERFPREPRLDLPFSARDYDGIALVER